MIPLLLAASLLLDRRPAPPSGDVIAIKDVTVIDVEAASEATARRSGMTVIVADGSIRSLGPADELPPPDGARVVDGSGRFLIPGLFDMHVHLQGAGEEALAMLVVEGVTSMRDLGGDMEVLDDYVRRIEVGELVGPRMARAGFVIESQGFVDRILSMPAGTYSERERDEFARTRIGVETEDDVLEAVARVSESGAEILKFRNTSSHDTFVALLREAHVAGLRVAGHEPNTIDLLEAVTLGMDSMEHMPAYAVMRGTSDERWQQIFAAMVEHRVYETPTLVTAKNRRMSADELEAAVAAEREDPRWGLLAPTLAEAWETQARERRQESPTDWKDLCTRGEAVVRAMHAAGVPFLAGTDLGVAFVYPGSGLHEELVRLVEIAGLTPLEALRAATSGAAEWLGWQDRVGTVAPGKAADLVLLDADPLADVSAVARIRGVVCRGIWYGPDGRERLRASVAAMHAR